MLTLDLPKKPYAYLWIGWSYAGKGDVSNAKLYFKKAIDSGTEISPDITDYLNSH